MLILKLVREQIVQVLNSFLSLSVFGLLSSSLLLFPQRFGQICHPAFLSSRIHSVTVIGVGSLTF